jgi:hypothetical protein
MEVMADLNNTENFDAQRLTEEIDAGEQKKPKVNVEADYELSKEFAVAEIDKTDAGAAAADKATENKFELSQPAATPSKLQEAGGDPDAFLDMAKEVHPTP